MRLMPRPAWSLIATALLIFLSILPSWARPTYELELALGEAWVLQGELTVQGTASDAWPELVFRNVHGAALEVTDVKRDAVAADWGMPDPWTLVIHGSLDAEQDFSVTIGYAISVPRFDDAPGFGTFARSDHTVVLGAAYPMLAVWEDGWVNPPVLDWGDTVVAEVADYRARVHVPPEWRVISGGEERVLEAGIVEISGEGLRELALVLVRDYAVLEDDAGSARVRSWHRPHRSAPAAEALETSLLALQLYGRLFAPYPFASLDIVEVPLRQAAGVEYPGLILVGQAYYDAYPREPLFFTMILAHEVAHQWWYALVGNDQVTEPWVDEALATYTSGLYFEAVGRWDEIYTYWTRTYESGRQRNPHARVDSPLWAFPDGAGYGGIVYSGGALMLHELRLAMGDEPFLDALTSYLDTHRWTLARGEDLLSALKSAAPVSIRPILDRYLD